MELSPPLLYGPGLVRRIESTEAANGADFARLYQKRNGAKTSLLEIAGGQIAFAGAGSPLSHALGLGMSGPVTEQDLDSVEEFYRRRGSAINLEICPLADAGFVELLGRRRYRITEFNNVLARTLDGPFPDPDAPVRQTRPEEKELWGRTVSRGFFERPDMSPEERALTSLLFDLPGGSCFLVEMDAAPAAAGALGIRDGVAVLFADSTLTEFRNRRLQSALIGKRLAVAHANGCTLATASTLPASSSQRNYQRHGFQILYTRLVMARD